MQERLDSFEPAAGAHRRSRLQQRRQFRRPRGALSCRRNWSASIFLPAMLQAGINRVPAGSAGSGAGDRTKPQRLPHAVKLPLKSRVDRNRLVQPAVALA